MHGRHACLIHRYDDRNSCLCVDCGDYISEKDAKNIDFTNEFIFDSSRRDLVQVDDVIAPKFLR